DPLTAQLVAGPAHAASFTLNADGTFDYAPSAGYTGPDSFTYRVTDGTLWSNVATASLTVTAIPLGHDDVYYLQSDGTIAVNAAGGVLSNDFSPGGSLQAQLVAPPSTRPRTFNADGNFNYTGAPSQPSVTFQYRPVQAAAPFQVGTVATVTLVAQQQQPNVSVRSVKFTGALPLVKDGDKEAVIQPDWTNVDGGHRSVVLV